MSFVKYDPGLGVARQDLGDCTVRALCITRTISYLNAWETIYSVQGELRLCGFDLPRMLSAMPKVFGVKRKISSSCETRATADYSNSVLQDVPGGAVYSETGRARGGGQGWALL